MTPYLRSAVAFWWAAAVLSLIATALLVNGGFGFYRTALGSGLIVLALIGSALFAVVLLRVSSVQRWALREGVASPEAARAFRLFAAFAGCFGIGMLIDMLRFL
jgi:hypothetical protein